MFLVVPADLSLDHEHGNVSRIYPRDSGGLAQAQRAQSRKTLPGLGPQASYARVIEVGRDAFGFEVTEPVDLPLLPFDVAGISGSYANGLENLGRKVPVGQARNQVG